MSVTGSSPCGSQSVSTSYQTSPTHRSSKRAFSAAASPRNIGPREKRARWGDFPSPRSFPPTTPSKLFDTLSTAPIPNPSASLFMNLASSAPATPLFPSSSSSFFPVISSSTGHNNSQMQPSLPPSPRHSRAMLDDLHREAFTSLRQSLAQSGEGFLRRMRDWEERRNIESSKASILDVLERGRDRRRTRRQRPTQTDIHTVGGTSEPHSCDNNCAFLFDVSHLDREPRGESGYGTFLSALDDSDIEDDMPIDNVGHSHTLAPSERKPHSPSLAGPQVDVPNSQEIFAIELAEANAERYPMGACTSMIGFPFTYSNNRSSFPFSLSNTIDDQSCRYDQPHSGFSSPSAVSASVDLSSHTISTWNQSGALGEGVHHSSADTSPCPPSFGFSGSRLATRRYVTVQSLDDTYTHMHPLHSRLAAVSEPSRQTASDKVMAALVLTLANGSGSLADYGYVREAQGELEELDAGGLWE